MAGFRDTYFFENALIDHAYQDKAFPIGEGQTISQPYTVAFQSEKLEIRPGDKVLEIGTGSGYQACILLELGAKVYTIEYNRKLYETVKSFLPRLGYRPHFFYGDGSKGLPSKAPFDKIIVTAGFFGFRTSKEIFSYVCEFNQHPSPYSSVILLLLRLFKIAGENWSGRFFSLY